MREKLKKRKYDIKKFNKNSFMFLKLKMKSILRKYNFADTIEEKLVNITNQNRKETNKKNNEKMWFYLVL